ncbi:MAG: hypothetical protein ABFR63_05760, partial [Thermodesulfobacteriota bacterium]
MTQLEKKILLLLSSNLSFLQFAGASGDLFAPYPKPILFPAPAGEKLTDAIFLFPVDNPSTFTKQPLRHNGED